MLLIELGRSRPKGAGKARLEYSDEVSQPTRKGDMIILPNKGSLGLFKLREDWTQFLVRDGYSEVWFGGTDENPFLVRMLDNCFHCYEEGGPEAFYKGLIPKLPTPNYSRQGDIFACPLPWSWEEIIKAYKLIHNWDVEPIEFKPTTENYSSNGGLFGTRHKLEGLILNQTVELPERFSSSVEQPFLVLVEGTVVAPDHTPMVLKGVHALAQTRYLHNPKLAD